LSRLCNKSKLKNAMIYRTSQAPKQNNRDIDATGSWLSIGDLMSVLLMVFALLLITALLQLAEESEKSRKTRIIIIQTLEKSLNDAGINVQTNPETGDISILDEILFEENDAILKQRGKDFLKLFVPVYSDVLFSKQNIGGDEIDVSGEVINIIIEGHASLKGDRNYNMILSARRSANVAAEISFMNFPNKAAFEQKIIVAGRGSLDADKLRDLATDRKVVFRFNFKRDVLETRFNQLIAL